MSVATESRTIRAAHLKHPIIQTECSISCGTGVIAPPIIYKYKKNSVILGTICMTSSQKEITSQADYYLVILSSKTYVFEDKLSKH